MAKKEQPDYTEMANWSAAAAAALRGLEHAFAVFKGLREGELELERLTGQLSVLANEAESLSKVKSNLERHVKQLRQSLTEMEPLEQKGLDLKEQVAQLSQDITALTAKRDAMLAELDVQTKERRDAIIRLASEEQEWLEKTAAARMAYQQLVSNLAVAGAQTEGG